MRTLLIATLAVTLAGCVYTKLHPGADAVRVTANSAAVEGCELLGEVKGADFLNGGIGGKSAGQENTDRRLKNKALALGGNVVHIRDEESNYYGTTARGEVYRCVK